MRNELIGAVSYCASGRMSTKKGKDEKCTKMSAKVFDTKISSIEQVFKTTSERAGQKSGRVLG
jgi:hypothetical protein